MVGCDIQLYYIDGTPIRNTIVAKLGINLRTSYLWGSKKSCLWFQKDNVIKRDVNRCRSLNLINGKQCNYTLPSGCGNVKRCYYHHYQFRVFTMHYHISHLEEFYGISDSSVAFVQFFLRKMYENIFYVTPEFYHLKWNGLLYGRIMQLPYNITNQTKDMPFYRNARC